ncbi:UNKNOWN [Stylonychia lemnae]|uniref:Uncharacterized protein n=1 Tax=Stylonychia lemnae TaxID=5949 RepID=A0A078A9N0_STYLE|nr:UNKNOWN [Stylonychia lemnae]|eukprot:CDW78980.1 UNKNOWN [Stylonychia lemnae]
MLSVLQEIVLMAPYQAAYIAKTRIYTRTFQISSVWNSALRISLASKQKGVISNQQHKVFYIDNTDKEQVIELGTLDFPYRNLDDPFREIFNQQSQNKPTVQILIREGVNITQYSSQVPLLLLQTDATLGLLSIQLRLLTNEHLVCLIQLSHLMGLQQIMMLMARLNKI